MAIWDAILERIISPVVNKSIKEVKKEEELQKGLTALAPTWRLQPFGKKGGVVRRTLPRGVKFQTLRDFALYYPILRACINYRKRQITQLKWDISSIEVITDKKKKEQYKKDAKEIKKILKYPTGDKSLTFRGFVNKIIEDLLVLDAVAIYRRRNKGGGIYGYLPIDATTIELVLYDDGTIPIPPDEAYQQKIRGEVKAELTTDELIYKMMNPRTDTPYGLSPVEALIIVITTALKLSAYNLSYLCYDDKTEILTKWGWKLFSDLTDEDVVATRSPKEKFEWQKPLKRVSFNYDDDLIRFKSRTVDLLVTPNHRMLVDYRSSNGEFVDSGKNIIKRADWFLENPKTTSQNYLAPTTSKWKGESPEYFELPGYVVERTGVFSGYAFAGRDKDGKPIRSKEKFTTEEKTITYKKPPVNVPIKDWVAFLGIYLAEGWVRADNNQSRHDVYIAQSKKSKHFQDIEKLLDRLPFKFRIEKANENFACSDARLWQYLKPFGKSYQKYIPDEVKNYSPELLKVLWEWMVKGDGHKHDNNVTYTTTSKKLADDCQEILQKIGSDSRMYSVKQKIGNIIGKKTVKTSRLIYKVIERLAKHRGLNCAKKEKYVGKVYSVKVPNGIVYVRRNGYPFWCGNTEGNIPEGLVELPEDIISSPDQLKAWQEAWDTMFSGDPRFQRKIKFLPAGIKLHPTKKIGEMQFERFEKWLLQNTCSILEVPPQAIGFQFERGKGATEAEWEIGKERGLFPTANFLKETFDQIIQDDLKSPHLEFVWVNINPTNKEEEAGVFSKLVNAGAVSVDEWRLGEGLDTIGCPHYIMTPVGPIFVKDLVSRSEAGISILPQSYQPGGSSPKPSKNVPQKIQRIARDEIVKELKRWKKVVSNDLKQGKGFRDFQTNIIDFRTKNLINNGLSIVKTKDQLNQLFDPLISQENQMIAAILDLYDEVSSIVKYNETVHAKKNKKSD